MTANIANQTAVTGTPTTSFINPSIVLASASLVALFIIALISMKMGLALIASLLFGAAYTAIRSFQQLNFDFELDNNLMGEVIEELQYRDM